MTVLNISLPAQERAYPLVIERGAIDHAGKIVSERLGKRRAVVVTDSMVAPLYLGRFGEALQKAGHTILSTIIVPAGEQRKSFEELQDLVGQILVSGADRKTVVFALGGGVIGDLSGFAASIALRGMDLVQVPTTLLAQVDSSIGGKNGINSSHGKNTVGTFYQPKLVLIDPDTLDTLPVRELLAGYAEVVKYGLIGDLAFFEWCADHAEALIDGDCDARIHAISKSCTAKAAIVEADEKESGLRALLNLGHTFGHALEAVIGYDSGQLLHGEAVAIGTVLAFRLSVELKLCPAAALAKVEKHFVDIGLPVAPPPYPYDISALMRCMAQDKKAEGGALTLVLARDIGDAFVMRGVDEKAVQKVWHDALM